MAFQKDPIEDVVITPFWKFVDERGWLAGIFRHDDLPAWSRPEMAYVSLTTLGILRGPHEHMDQAYLFVWVGLSNFSDFKLTLWDNRPDSPTYQNRIEVATGVNNLGSAMIPKGVVHCSHRTGNEPSPVINCLDRLFMGQGKADPIEEIRYEDDLENPFVQDEQARGAHLL